MATAKTAPAKKAAAKPAAAAAKPATAPATTAAAAKKREPNSGFMKAMTPSAPLAAVIGQGPYPRTEVTSKIWQYIKEHNLQDPAKKRIIVADAKLQAVFGKDRVDMFEMTKIVNQHLK